jgi:Mycothiol maleylpyruvate isomerase N-terminal domain/MDMPI C-terminal domain
VATTDLLQFAEQDARSLLGAAEIQWDRPVPHGPEWDEAGLVRHMGSILYWQAAIVSSGELVSRRTLEPAPPENPDDLPAWYLAGLSQALEVFGSADSEAATWTFSRLGDQHAGWWFRRLPVEVAIHRWDAEHAVTYDDQGGASPQPISGDVAAAGIEEFVVEFLPGLVARDDIVGFTGTLRLQAEDGPTAWWIDLDDGGRAITEPADADADTTLRGTRSDLLLWLNNRGPLETIEVAGNQTILDRWGQLTF